MAIARKVQTGRVLEDVSSKPVARTTAATNHFNGNVLAQELMACYAPLVAALDDKPAFMSEGDADNGQEKASVLDNAMKYEIDNFIQNLYRQNYGVITIQKKDPKTGKPTGATSTIPNGKERLDASLMAVDALTEISSPDDYQKLHWLRVNEARFDARNHLLGALQAVRKTIFHESWKPADMAPITKTVAKDIAPEEKERALAELARVKARMRG